MTNNFLIGMSKNLKRCEPFIMLLSHSSRVHHSSIHVMMSKSELNKNEGECTKINIKA